MSSRVLADGRGRHLVVDAHPDELMPGDKDTPTTTKETHAIIIDALIDYNRAAPVSFWRTMKRLGIHVIHGKQSEALLVPPNLSKYLCPRCGHGGVGDALCPQCQEETEL